MIIVQSDFEVTGGGSVYLVTPTNESARKHLSANVGEEATWLGKGLGVEHRYISDLVNNLENDGFSVEVISL